MTDNCTAAATQGLPTLWAELLQSDAGRTALAKATPSVIYAEKQILANIGVYAQAGQGLDKELHYAVKACPLSPVLRCLASAGWGADCQSVMEAELALQSGIEAKKISICSPRLALPDISWALQRGISLIADSPGQLEMIEVTSHKLAPPPHWRLGVRVSLPVSGTARFHTKLGMEPETIISAINAAPSLKPFLTEIHHHGAARECHATLPTEIANSLAASLLQIERNAAVSFLRINLGGGLEPESIIQENGSSTEQIIAAMIGAIAGKLSWQGRTLVLEPGRAIVKDAAVACTTVTNLKSLRGLSLAVVDVSTNLLIPLPLAQFRAHSINKPALSQYLIAYDIVDGTCSPAGVVCKNALLPELHENDRLLISQVGGYTWSLAEPFYDYLPSLLWLARDGSLKEFLTNEQARQLVRMIWGYCGP